MTKLFRNLLILVTVTGFLGNLLGSVFSPFTDKLVKALGINSATWVAPVMGVLSSHWFTNGVWFLGGVTIGFWGGWFATNWDRRRDERLPQGYASDNNSRDSSTGGSDTIALTKQELDAVTKAFERIDQYLAHDFQDLYEAGRSFGNWYKTFTANMGDAEIDEVFVAFRERTESACQEWSRMIKQEEFRIRKASVDIPSLEQSMRTWFGPIQQFKEATISTKTLQQNKRLQLVNPSWGEFARALSDTNELSNKIRRILHDIRMTLTTDRTDQPQ